MDYVSYYGRYRPTNEHGQNEDSMIGAGNDLYWVPQLARKNTSFDGNIPYHQDGLEYILDHAFGHLLTNNKPPHDKGLDDAKSAKRRKQKGGYVGSDSPYDGSICHPVVFTEAPLIPLYSRNLISQLLFECYSAPSICSGIDSCFSLYYDHFNKYKGTSMMSVYGEDQYSVEEPLDHVEPLESLSSLVVSSGYSFTHLLPVVDGAFDGKSAMRLSVGGSQSTDFLLKTLQLRYPEHKALYTPESVSKLKEDHCYISKDFSDDAKKCSQNREDFSVKIKLPYEVKAAPVVSEEEKQKREKRKQENAQRMREMSRKKQIEKAEEKSTRLAQLNELKDKKESSPDTFEGLLLEAGYDKEATLLKEISDIEKYLEKAKEKIASYDKEPQEIVSNSKESDEEFLKQLIKQRDEVYTRIESRKKEKISNYGRQSRVAKNRMKLIAQAADETLQDDEFGKRDSDWNVYLDMAIKNNTEDVNTQDEALLAQLEKEILAIQGVSESPINNEMVLDFERFRIPEILYQPSIIGVDQPGLGEAVNILMHRQKEETSRKLLKRVYLSGGNTCWRNILHRTYSTIAQEIPHDLVLGRQLNIIHASDPIFGAWKGAALFATLEENKKFFITRESYFEDGWDRIYTKAKLHLASNPVITKIIK